MLSLVAVHLIEPYFLGVSFNIFADDKVPYVFCPRSCLLPSLLESLHELPNDTDLSCNLQKNVPVVFSPRNPVIGKVYH